MQLYRKISSLSQTVWDAAKKTDLGEGNPKVRARVKVAKP